MSGKGSAESVRGYEIWGYGAPSAPAIAQALADAVLALLKGQEG